MEIFTRLINHILRAWFYEENILHNFLTRLVLTDITTVVYCWTRNWLNYFSTQHFQSHQLIFSSVSVIYNHLRKIKPPEPRIQSPYHRDASEILAAENSWSLFETVLLWAWDKGSSIIFLGITSTKLLAEFRWLHNRNLIKTCCRRSLWNKVGQNSDMNDIFGW